jgi:hypothetical protein
VRRPDTTKQRLWLGTSQYRNGCRNAATNANRFTDSCVKRYSVRGDNTNAYAKRACDAYTNSYGNSHSDGYTSSKSNTYSERHHSSIAYTYGDSSAQSNTKASSDSASSALSARFPACPQ